MKRFSAIHDANATAGTTDIGTAATLQSKMIMETLYYSIYLFYLLHLTVITIHIGHWYHDLYDKTAKREYLS